MKIFEAEDRYVVKMDERENWRFRFSDHYKHLPSLRAKIAIDFVTKWGMVAAIPNGEDSAGRSKLRLSEPPEIVQRATETADMLVQFFEENGWLLEMPDAKDLYAQEEETE